MQRHVDRIYGMVSPRRHPARHLGPEELARALLGAGAIVYRDDERSGDGSWLRADPWRIDVPYSLPREQIAAGIAAAIAEWYRRTVDDSVDVTALAEAIHVPAAALAILLGVLSFSLEEVAETFAAPIDLVLRRVDELARV
jgi:hypothetical protein